MGASLEGDLGARLVRHEASDIEEDYSRTGDRDLKDDTRVRTESRIRIDEDVVVKRGNDGFSGFRVDEGVRSAHCLLHLDQISVLVEELSQGVVQDVLVKDGEPL